MAQKIKAGILKTIEEEIIKTTDTLWENEIRANYFVVNMLIFTAIIDLVFILLGYFDVFVINKSTMMPILIQTLFELLVPAFLCIALKGRKKWLKVLMLTTYTFALARVQSVFTYSVTLIMVFPIILSIRYYSRIFTSFIATITVLLSGFVEYFAIMFKTGRLDFNLLEVPAGTTLTFNETATLRDVIGSLMDINYDSLWINTLQHSYLPKILFYLIIAVMATEIAKRGRISIFAQQAETKKTERISTELNLAGNIQSNMLPNIFPAFPDKNEFDIYATMNPAKQVGGDFYDFFMIDDDHLAMVIADVSGKGIPAALFMVIAKTLIKDHSQLGLTPGQVFTRVNNLLCEGNEEGLFVTAWMGVLDINSGNLTYVNAGHNPPVVKLDGEIKYLDCEHGFVLAGLENYQYKEFNLKLNTGDKIFLYTDGATEATDINNNLYGEERLLNCLSSLPDNISCADALLAVRNDIDNFVGEAEQFDDLTLLAFDFTDKDSKGTKTVERTFDASDDKLYEVMEFVEQALEEHGASPKAMMAINVSLEEIFVNIAHYAYEDGKGKATVGMRFDNDDVEIYFIDNGIPFNPLAKEDPDVQASIDEREIGGLGIYMVKQSMDECHYERKNNQNIFTMKRNYKL